LHHAAVHAGSDSSTNSGAEDSRSDTRTDNSSTDANSNNSSTDADSNNTSTDACAPDDDSGIDEYNDADANHPGTADHYANNHVDIWNAVYDAFDDD
jgi:hypothetical protein